MLALHRAPSHFVIYHVLPLLLFRSQTETALRSWCSKNIKSEDKTTQGIQKLFTLKRRMIQTIVENGHLGTIPKYQGLPGRAFFQQVIFYLWPQFSISTWGKYFLSLTFYQTCLFWQKLLGSKSCFSQCVWTAPKTEQFTLQQRQGAPVMWKLVL